MRLLQKICLFLVFLCAGLLPSLCAIAQHPTPEVQKAIVEVAERWGVPQPAPDSLVVKIWTSQPRKGNPFFLGFLDPENPGWALVGFDRVDITHDYFVKEFPDFRQLSVEDMESRSPLVPVHDVNVRLITGIQLLRSGHEHVGLPLIIKALRESTGHHLSPFRSPTEEDPLLMLARSCLAAALNDISSRQPDFSAIKQRIDVLVADQPGLRSKALDRLMQSLQASIDYEPSPEGSIERVVDDFLLAGGTEDAMSGRVGEFQPAERALILKGFEAIPALIAQRHSPRLTNYRMQGFNNIPNYPMTAGHVIDGYLQRFANNNFDSGSLERQRGILATDEAVAKWWKEASAIGEEAYIRENTVKTDEQRFALLSMELLLLAEVRYPELLPDFCQEILGTSTPSSPVLEAILRSAAFPRDRKLELLAQAIATNHPSHRNAALGLLQNFDPTVADKYLLEFLDKCPATAAVEYWNDQNAHLGRYVSNSVDPEVWRAFHALLERADLGMRMQLIDALYPRRDAPEPVLRSYHAVFLRFRDDETIRDESTSEKYGGPGAGFPYTRIAMQDFIYLHWARWLTLGFEPPAENATPDEWEAYREAVDIAMRSQEAEEPAPRGQEGHSCGAWQSARR